MTWFEVLVEGTSDVPVMKEVFTRKFKLSENENFRIHPHHGKGKLPFNVLAKPDRNQRGLLHQLPAKLRAFAHSSAIVLVVVDADDQSCIELLSELNAMLIKLGTQRPSRIIFRIAIEEIESWFIADPNAIKAAFPKAKVGALKKIKPDAIIGAWEKLAEAIHMPSSAAPISKKLWAEKISPYLNLDDPSSPSLRKLLEGIDRELKVSSVLAITK